jgi:hypothetical protein
MPSDQVVAQALLAVRGPRETFRRAVVQAVEQVRSFLASQRPAPTREVHARAELGAFARERLDTSRFAALFGSTGGLLPEELAQVERALEVLRAAADAGDRLYGVEVERGAELRHAVDWALARTGRVFGAAQTVELIRTRRYSPERHHDMLDEAFPFLHSFPFRRWNRAERQIAPPLVVELEGEDLRVGGLEEFLEGTQKIVLLVRGPCPPAALVRLVTPGVLVAQTADPAELEPLCSATGPAIVALVPDGAATFVHHPAGGATLADRLTVRHLPETEPAAALGGLGLFQQREELRQLRALSTPVAPVVVAGKGADAGVVAAGDPAERLAAWLLSQADLSDPA